MSILVLLVGLLALAGVVIGVVMLVFRRHRRKGRWIASCSFATLVVSFIYFAVVGAAAADKAAKEAGFQSADDLREAQAAGIEAPETWAVEKAARAERLAKVKAAEKARAAQLRAEAEVAKRQEQQEREGHKDPAKFLQLRNVKWERGGFDTVIIISFSLYNPLNFGVKDVTIKCVHASKSGTVIDSNTRVIYDTFPERSSKQVYRFNMGFIHSQAVSTHCKATDAVAM